MSTSKTDIIYALGSGSKWNNYEILLSIRSLCKYLKNFGNIYIVGENPGFLKNIIHIPCDDIFPPEINADGNIINKVLTACSIPEISEDFLFINDDHIFLKPIHVLDIPPFHKGDMSAFPESYFYNNAWRQRLAATRDILLKNNLSALHFDCHTPILFNKKLFPDVIRRFDYQKGFGYTMKSLYGNLVYPDAPQLNGEKKTIFKFKKIPEINTHLQDATFLSFNDFGLNRSLKVWLFQKFASPSPYEEIPVFDIAHDLAQYIVSGYDYQTGLNYFFNHQANSHLTDVFHTRKNQSLENKLAYKLKNLINPL